LFFACDREFKKTIGYTGQATYQNFMTMANQIEKKLGKKALSIALLSSLGAIVSFGFVNSSLAQTTAPKPTPTLSAEKKAECMTLKNAVQKLGTPISKKSFTPEDTAKELKAIAKGIQDVKISDADLKLLQSGFVKPILELAETVIEQNTNDFRSEKLQPAVQKFFKDFSPIAKKAAEVCPGV
jgi:hypothetical protein